MPIPIAVAIREQIVQQRESGKNLCEIAQGLGIAYESVRNVWRLYQKEGRISPNYERCGVKGAKASKRVYRAALFLKRLHPSWGAPLIGQIIQEKWLQERIGNARSLQRWFKQAGVNQPRKKPVGRHEKDEVKWCIRYGKWIVVKGLPWLEGRRWSGWWSAMKPVVPSCKGQFSPLAKANQLRAETVSEFLRTCFERWGLPKA